ncbi:MAG: aspartate--tRNA(Asn) ligase [Candidatus Aenigmarchaeota archaeon]|nr:aspartate--tRNA(Asn) ligase [Candidatus Aenigmarchaeota archaeon]
MERHYVSEISPSMDGNTVNVYGWVESIRDLGSLKFIVLRDMTGTIQMVVKKGAIDAGTSKIIDSVSREFVVKVRCLVKKNEKAPGGRELLPKDIEIVSVSETNFPTDITDRTKSHLDTRLDWRPLDLRNTKNAAIFRLQSKIVSAFHEFFQGNGFVHTFTPSIMGNPAESGSEVFPVVYFNKQAFLRQDPQLHRQLTVAGGLDKVYEIGPSWRAELSHTVKHLCEHRTCAAEIGFIEDEYDVIKLEESMIVNIFKKLSENAKNGLETLGVRISAPKAPFPILEFPEIYGILESMGKKLKRGSDLDTESEKLLAKYVMEKYGSEFFFVNKIPFSIKPFYVMRDDETEYARSVDLYFREIEMSSGGQREHRYDNLMKNIKEKKLDAAGLEWFTKFFKLGGIPPHGGFSIGIERLTKQIANIENVREAVLFPRDPERLVP